MGIMDFIGKQFIDVIEWNESGDGVLAYRFPMRDQEIQNGAQLTVRETQLALFVNEGRVADQFGSGLHTLNTRTLPILTNLQNWDKAFASPFKSDVYFFSTRQQIDQKWGTPTPVTIRDKEFGPIRVRAHGIYAYKIENPKVFFEKVSGTRDQYTATELSGQLLGTATMALASFLGGADVPFVDMAANQLKFSETLREALAPSFATFGLKLESFQVSSVSLPDELQKVFDERASMRIVGDMRSYTQFQTARSIPLAASNEGGVAGAGAGLGAGMAMGQAMAQAMATGAAQPGATGEAIESPLTAIEKLHELFKKGILTEAEFSAKKSELMKKV